MILSTNLDDQHFEDGDVIKLRDGECSGAEERMLRAHLEVCSTCRENADRIETLADGFVAAVKAIRHPTSVELPELHPKRETSRRGPLAVTAPWHTRRGVRVAAVLALVTALALTTAPARALVGAGWQAIKTLFVGTPTPENQAQQTTALVSFAPRGEEFLVDFVHTQALGTLTVRIDTSASASARVLGGDGQDEMIVLQAGLRIMNTTASTASYELRLPPFLRDVEVRVASRTVATFSTVGMTGGARWEVDLTGR
jgi:hypothetical protein